jgi:hypothetical protein
MHTVQNYDYFIDYEVEENITDEGEGTKDTCITAGL